MSDWQEVVAPEDLRVASPDGAYLVVLAAGVTTRIHPSLFDPAIAAGCSIPGGSPGQAEPNAAVVAKVEVAMRAILAEGKESDVTKDGMPRYNVLRQKAGVFTEEQKAEAWGRVLADVTAPEAD